ncbi:hypothetical protein HMPREF1986_00766 [Oribacterium sp. oral taxon 078 str. F0263]|nr:hypothetical protein HMPREF1986_00766 [Oribacterium sp. oral taxon 078 str. F0263]
MNSFPRPGCGARSDIGILLHRGESVKSSGGWLGKYFLNPCLIYKYTGFEKDIIMQSRRRFGKKVQKTREILKIESRRFIVRRKKNDAERLMEKSFRLALRRNL